MNVTHFRMCQAQGMMRYICLVEDADDVVAATLAKSGLKCLSCSLISGEDAVTLINASTLCLRNSHEPSLTCKKNTVEQV